MVTMDGGREGCRLRADFVGRGREFAALKDCVAAALAGGPRVVLCRGEPGIGKTRLAEELATAAEIAGVPPVWGVAAESAGAYRSAPPAADEGAGVTRSGP